MRLKSSTVPVLTTVVSGYPSEDRHINALQSPQKWSVMVFPLATRAGGGVGAQGGGAARDMHRGERGEEEGAGHG
ncbi:hypothetical protein BDZ85DRAFT_254140 [Elsinoe ampelina]|uniref:Uncharacterized protein n=1 Tax=Elsinoe ampelina TaxID=302913 RepID=A0A6A6GNI5_9PEZI|nr:hypothetical protein BDZ85DRAFT_254140 [Elsinoe ampelina]